MWRVLILAGLAVTLGGCASGPLHENPLPFRVERAVLHENPLYLPQGERAYSLVFEKCLDVLSDYFVLAYHNRYDGRIETLPTIAPGIEQPWKPGSPDFYQRLLAFCQTIRHRAIVQITTARDGGYFIHVQVLKELEDLPRPTRVVAGDATFRMEATVQRDFEIVVPEFFEANWIPIGRDYKLEQVILDRLACLDMASTGR
jgi:hypothetical protein